jgi:hypothetical protein
MLDAANVEWLTRKVCTDLDADIVCLVIETHMSPADLEARAAIDDKSARTKAAIEVMESYIEYLKYKLEGK